MDISAKMERIILSTPHQGAVNRARQDAAELSNSSWEVPSNLSESDGDSPPLVVSSTIKLSGILLTLGISSGGVKLPGESKSGM